MHTQKQMLYHMGLNRAVYISFLQYITIPNQYSVYLLVIDYLHSHKIVFPTSSQNSPGTIEKWPERSY